MYKNTYRCVAAHQKFGFRIYVTADTEDVAKNIAGEIETLLNKTMLMSKPLIESYAKDALERGEIIVENKFSELHRQYDYFRKKVALKNKQESNKKHPNIYLVLMEKQYLEQAAYFSFYSMLEHLCVLFLAFRDIPERRDVAGFARKKWSEKYKLVFDINKPEFKKIYDHLFGLAKYQRNPAAHGRTDTVFSFFLDGANHKVSVSIHEHELALGWLDEKANFDTLESFLSILKNHPDTKNMFSYVENGFNVNFDSPSHNDSIVGMSETEISEYSEYMMRKYDDMANMDW